MVWFQYELVEYFVFTWLKLFYSGGLSNWLYHVRLRKAVNNSVEVPKEVLLRLYGQSHGECGVQHLISESVIFALLSERNLGPRLHGVFAGGRIEEYVPVSRGEPPLRAFKNHECKDSTFLFFLFFFLSLFDFKITLRTRIFTSFCGFPRGNTTEKSLMRSDEGRYKNILR